MCWSDFEAIEGLTSCSTLNFRRELKSKFLIRLNQFRRSQATHLDESNVVTPRNQTHFFESGELVEEHAQHHLVRFIWKVGQEENLVGRLFSVRALNGSLSWVHRLWFLGPENQNRIRKIFCFRSHQLTSSLQQPWPPWVSSVSL